MNSKEIIRCLEKGDYQTINLLSPCLASLDVKEALSNTFVRRWLCQPEILDIVMNACIIQADNNLIAATLSSAIQHKFVLVHLLNKYKVFITNAQMGMILNVLGVQTKDLKPVLSQCTDSVRWDYERIIKEIARLHPDVFEKGFKFNGFVD